MPSNNSKYTQEIREKAGYPYDNSAMESFFSGLKKEFFYRREYATIEDVEEDLFYYQNEGNEARRCLTNSMHMA